MNMSTMDCGDARPLVPSYLDGELTEAQAAPLRKHLLACQACRAGAQADKNMKRWFAVTEPIAVPRGFSGRVARAAFAGVESMAHVPTEFERRSPRAAPILPGPTVAVASSSDLENGGIAVETARRDEGRILVFVLRLTVAAAVLALLASVAIQSLRRPSTAELRADDRNTMTLDAALEKLDQIERTEAGKPVAAPR